MKKDKTLMLTGISILVLFVIAIFIYVLESYEYNLPKKKVSPFVKRNLPPPRRPRAPLMPDDMKKYPGIAIIIMNDRTVCFNEDPVDWNFLEERLRDIYQIRTDKSIRIIKEDKAFQEDFLIVMDIIKRLGLEVKGIITLEKGQVARSEGLVHAELDSNSPKLIHLASAKRLKKIKHVNPITPYDVPRINAVVIVKVVIDVKGHVKSARVISGNLVWNDSVLNAVKQWEYEPFRVNGKAVPVDFTVTITFSIRDQP